MQRRPTTQDITWLVDLHQNVQLDLDPPYQRRSVWTRRDKQFFLDTIFRNYPSPAIFLHKTITEAGKATYHVVDGKQRTQTILDFIHDRLRIGDFGDNRLDGKKWSQLQGEQELKQSFWNYQITVEMIDVLDGTIVNQVFDRLNRNARKLTRQELRHAQFDGWLISEAETEAAREEWRTLGVATPSRVRRMVDTQFISELMLVVLEGKPMGFDQDALDELYAKYEEPSDTAPEFNQEEFQQRFATARSYVLQMNGEARIVSEYARGFGNFYTLWTLVALTDELPPAVTLAGRYRAFMEKANDLAQIEELDAFLREDEGGEYKLSFVYLTNSRGASTDLGPRAERLKALMAALIGEDR
jgi:Protein of unknown function DUF262